MMRIDLFHILKTRIREYIYVKYPAVVTSVGVVFKEQ